MIELAEPYLEAEPRCCEIELSAAVEDYLKGIYRLATRQGYATTSGVAAEIGVSPPSSSAMLKRLAAAGLVERQAPGVVELTEHGQRHALRVVRRHRLLETFLASVLGVPWDEIHAEAEVLEHVLSERLEQRIDVLLGCPTHDPHGDPIPRPDGTHDETWATPLAAAAPGTLFRVERVSDRSSEALRWLANHGIRPGVTLEVEDRSPFGGPLWVRTAAAVHALGEPLTRMVHGTVLGASEPAGGTD